MLLVAYCLFLKILNKYVVLISPDNKPVSNVAMAAPFDAHALIMKTFNTVLKALEKTEINKLNFSFL